MFIFCSTTTQSNNYQVYYIWQCFKHCLTPISLLKHQKPQDGYQFHLVANFYSRANQIFVLSTYCELGLRRTKLDSQNVFSKFIIWLLLFAGDIKWYNQYTSCFTVVFIRNKFRLSEYGEQSVK